jgi:PKHD-type hydroxylase
MNEFEMKMDEPDSTEHGNLVNYYYYCNIFDSEQIEKIIEISKKYTILDANVSGTINHDYRKTNICWMPFNEETKFIYDKITYYAKDANKKMWNFNIPFLKEKIQFSVYEAEQQGHYDWHMDIGGGKGSTRKMSMSIQLSDPKDYKGGELEFMLHRNIHKAPQNKGDVIFFPSYLMHRVKKVTEGTRYSLVFWFHGPPFS